MTIAPRVCVVLVNWNNWTDTVECLESLGAVSGPQILDIVVVENGSANGSGDELASWIGEKCERTGLHALIVWADELEKTERAPLPEAPTITLVRSRLNRGFAGGGNIGLRYGLQVLNADYYWLLNNDTTVHPDAIAALLCAARNRADGILGSTIVDYHRNGHVQVAGGARYNRLLTLSRPLLAGVLLEQALNYGGDDSVDYIAGAAMFFRNEVLQRVGLLSEDYFLFYEELDYARRSLRCGYGLAWCRQSIVYHKGGMVT